MDTIQIQSASAVSTLPASTSLNDASVNGDSFTLTLGRALQSTPDSPSDGPSNSQKAAPRGKGTGGGNADSSSMAGIFLNCFVSSVIQPASTVILSSEHSGSSIDLQGSASMPDSRPGLGDTLSASGTATSVNAGTLFPRTTEAVATPEASFSWASVAPPTTAKPDTSKLVGRGRGQFVAQAGALITTVGHDVPVGSNELGHIGASTSVQGPQDASLLTKLTERQDEEAPSTQAQVSSSFPTDDLASASTPSLSPAGDSVPAPTPGISDGSTAPPAPFEPAESSSQMEAIVSAGAQAASNTSEASREIGPSVAAPGQGPSDSSLSSNPNDRPEQAEFSSQLEQFADAEVNLKASGDQSQQSTTPVEPTSANAPVLGNETRSGLGKDAEQVVHLPAAPKVAHSLEVAATGTPHGTQPSTSLTSEAAEQKGNTAESASAPATLSSSAKTVSSSPLGANSQAATPATSLHEDTPPQADAVPPSSAWPVNAGQGAAHANLTDSPPSGQGRSGQSVGTAPGNNPAGVTSFAPTLVNNSVADSAASLLAPHAPSPLTSHTASAAAQMPPSSSQPATTLPAWQNYDGGAGKIVRSASLTESASGAEMHVELRSGPLGPLEVHAVVNEGTVGAEIHAQGQAAHTLLADGLPSLERALGERNLRVENIALYQDAAGGMSGGDKQNQHSGSPPTPQGQAGPWDGPPEPRSTPSSSLEEEDAANPVSGLSVRA